MSHVDITSSLVDQLAGKINLSGGTFTGMINIYSASEKLNAVSHTSNVFDLNMNTGNVFYASNQPTANFTVNITNVPTAPSSQQFTVALFYTIASTDFYASTVSATNTSDSSIVSASTPKWAWAMVPTTVPSASVYVQTFTILQVFPTKYILSNRTAFN